MDKNEIISRKEACFLLGVKEDAGIEQVKRAYRYKAKLYHPDENLNKDTKEYYVKIQKAYEYLLNNPYDALNSQNNRDSIKSNGVQFNNSTPVSNPYANYYGNYYNYQQMYANSVNNTQFYNQPVQQRPAKIFSTNDKVRTQYVKQKEKENERKKVQKWEEENKKAQEQSQYVKEKGFKYSGTTRKDKEQEIIERIKAIWLAETIKRQIELDKEKYAHEQRKKVYKAFMQQKMNDEE